MHKTRFCFVWQKKSLKNILLNHKACINFAIHL